MYNRILLRACSLAYNAGHYRAADLLSNALIGTHQGSIWSRRLKSRTQYNLGNYSRTLEHLATLERLNDLDKAMIFLRCKALYNLGRFEDVKSEVAKIGVNHTSDHQVLTLHSRLSLRFNDNTAAIAHGTRALESGGLPKDIVPILARSAQRGNLWLEALDSLSHDHRCKTVFWDQFDLAGLTDYDIGVALTNIAMADERFDVAIKIAMKLGALNPEQHIPHDLITSIQLYKTLDYDEAVISLRKWIERFPNQPTPHRRLLYVGTMLASEDIITEALQIISERKPLDQKSVTYAMGRLAFHKQFSGILEAWWHNLNHTANETDEILLRANHMYTKGDFSGALDALEIGVLDSTKDEVCSAFARMCMLNGETSRLESHMSELMRADPKNSLALRARCNALLKSGRLKELDGVLTENRARLPLDLLRMQIGIELYENVDHNRALSLTNIALQDHPTDYRLLAIRTLMLSREPDQEMVIQAISRLKTVPERAGNGSLVIAQALANIGRPHERLQVVNTLLDEQGLSKIHSLDLNHSLHPNVLRGLQDENTVSGPLVSVIMTTFNQNDVVDAAIDSILNQTYCNLELLIVDDCSTDDVKRVLEKKALGDKRIKLMSTRTNSGTYIAKNIAMAKSRGEYITFMDSDDWAHPQRIEFQVNCLEKKEHAMATINDYCRITQSGDILIQSGIGIKLSCISLMIRRKVFAEIGFFDSLRVGADSEFIERIQAYYGNEALHHQHALTNFMLSSTDSLSGGGKFAIGWRGITGPRLRNRGRWMEWHNKIRTGNAQPYVEQSPLSRPYTCDPEML